LSNETTFQVIIPDMLKTAKPGRVYVGVGPEQNFTYMVALKPAMAIILDIRHGNLDVHLMYKALFELSKDRAEFVGKLFSRKRPNGLTTKSTASEIFDAYEKADGSKELYEATLAAIVEHLTKKHSFPLTPDDIDGIAWALTNFYNFGPAINYNSSLSLQMPPTIVGATGGGRGGGNSNVNYGRLMTSDDGQGNFRSYLASEENFTFLKELETKNLVIPVVGDFGGEKAIRAVGKYLKSIDAMVSAFYLSNVEQYLLQDDKWDRFCGNTATLPLDDSSVFIRSGQGGPNTTNSTGRNVQASSFAPILPELKSCMNVAKAIEPK
jgi:hypothetical protein